MSSIRRRPFAVTAAATGAVALGQAPLPSPDTAKAPVDCRESRDAGRKSRMRAGLKPEREVEAWKKEQE